MNRLTTEKRVAVIAALVEGTSINATCRMTWVAKHTLLKLLKDMGCACAALPTTFGVWRNWWDYWRIQKKNRPPKGRPRSLPRAHTFR